MPEYLFTPPAPPSLPIVGMHKHFPVHRIFCVGRNYAAHTREMGGDPKRDAPFFFSKPADALVASGAEIAYPTATAELHHEIELVLAIDKPGRAIPQEQAQAWIFGYAVGIDLTRRDQQTAAKQQGQPWDVAKAFDHSAPCSAIKPIEVSGHPQSARIWLQVNGETRQLSDIRDMLYTPAEIIAHLSNLFQLQAGDLIFTGTPAGVGPLLPGDRVYGGIDAIGEIHLHILANS